MHRCLLEVFILYFLLLAHEKNELARAFGRDELSQLFSLLVIMSQLVIVPSLTEPSKLEGPKTATRGG